MIERRQTEAEPELWVAQLSLINGIGRRIASNLNLDTVLDTTARLVQETFDYHHVALFLLDGQVLRLQALAGAYESFFPPQYTQKLGEGLNGWVAAHGQKVVANDVRAEPRYTSSIAKQTITQAELCLPINVAGQIVGVLDIQSPQLNAFSEYDVIALETLTDQIAVAIENARLHESVQRKLAERKRVEEALKQAHDELEHRVEEHTAELRRLEERYRNLFDNANDLIQSVDADGHFSYVNRSWLEAMEYTLDEIPNLRLEDVIHPNEIPHCRDMIQRLQARERFINERLVMLTKTGRNIVVEGNFTPYFEREQFIACRGILRDVTEREHAENTLRESEEKYRTLIEQSSDAIYLLYGGRFEVVNRKFEELFGVTQEDANAPDFVFTNIVAPKSRGLVKELAEKETEGQILRPRYEFAALDRDGNEIEVELTVSYPTYQGGLATQGIIRDITERKRNEDEKRKAYQQVQQYAEELAEKIREEQRQREIAHILAEVVSSVSLTLSTDELLDHILLKLQQLVSYDSASIFLVEGENLVIQAARGFDISLIEQQHALADDTLFQEMLARKGYILIKDIREDNRYRPWPGTEEARCWAGAPLLVAQEVIGYLSLDRYLPGIFSIADADLVQAFAHQVAQAIHNARLFTELKQTQAQLIQRERLAALGQMAAAVAHELRNPLMSIRMGVEYLLKDVSETDPRQRGAALMKANMDRIDRIIEDILFIARAPQPTLTPDLLRLVIEDELARWELTLSEKEIVCHTQFEDELPPILLDHDQMGRALSNLIDNSVDAMGSGGEIHLTLHGENSNQVITLSDNGPGIPPENQAKIFEPFFTTKSRGTGLGLSIVKQIIDFHRGSIDVWSEVGVGAKIIVTLPQQRRTWRK